MMRRKSYHLVKVVRVVWRLQVSSAAFSAVDITNFNDRYDNAKSLPIEKTGMNTATVVLT